MLRELDPASNWVLVRRAKRGEVPATYGVWPLYVGLFLALLTFFIALVSLSPPEESRTSAVLESLQRAFAPLPPTAESEALFAAGRSALAELGGDLSGIVRVATVARNRGGDEMRVRLPLAELFADDTTVMRPEIAKLLDRTVAAISSPPAGLRLQVSFALGQPKLRDGSADHDGGDLSRAISRSGVIARELIARGASPGAIAIAIDPASPDKATFAFRFQFASRVKAAADGVIRP